MNKALARLLASFLRLVSTGDGASSSGRGTVEMTGPFSSCAISGDPSGTGATSAVGGTGGKSSGTSGTGISTTTRVNEGVGAPGDDNDTYMD